jgi:hypothetical protein
MRFAKNIVISNQFIFCRKKWSLNIIYIVTKLKNIKGELNGMIDKDKLV